MELRRSLSSVLLAGFLGASCASSDVVQDGTDRPDREPLPAAFAGDVVEVRGDDAELEDVDVDAEPSEFEEALGEYAFAGLPKGRKSVTIGNLDELACNKELKKLKIPHVRAPGAAKIEQPIIVTGPINGVHFDTGRPYKLRSIATGDAIDCRLAVALYDLTKVVKKHGIGTVLVKSFHRPNQVIVDPNAPLRHRVGFAIDIAGFKTKKGVVWNVQKDFHGKIGQVSCGAKAAKPVPDTKVARELWATFCQIIGTEAFDSGISPNYNASHFDHVHFDLTTDHPILFFP